MGVKLTFKELKSILEEVDRDGSGEVEYGEFVEIVTSSLHKDAANDGGATPDFSVLAAAYRRRKLLDTLFDEATDKVTRQQLLDKVNKDTIETKSKRYEIENTKKQSVATYQSKLLESSEEFHKTINQNYPGETIVIQKSENDLGSPPHPSRPFTPDGMHPDSYSDALRPSRNTHLESSSSPSSKLKRNSHHSGDKDCNPYFIEDKEVRDLISSMTPRRASPPNKEKQRSAVSLPQQRGERRTMQGEEETEKKSVARGGEYRWTRLDSNMWVQEQQRVDDGKLRGSKMGGREHWSSRKQSHAELQGGQLSMSFLRTSSLTPTTTNQAYPFRQSFSHKSNMQHPCPAKTKQIHYLNSPSPLARSPSRSSSNYMYTQSPQLLKGAPRPRSVPNPVHLGSTLPPSSNSRSITPLSNPSRGQSPSEFFGLRPSTPIDDWPFAGSFVPNLPATTTIPDNKPTGRKLVAPTKPPINKPKDGFKRINKTGQFSITVGPDTIDPWDTHQFP